MNEHEPEITGVDESQVEERSLGHDIGLIALGAGASGFLNPLGHDLYDRAKEVATDLIRPSAEEQPFASAEDTKDG